MHGSSLHWSLGGVFKACVQTIGMHLTVKLVLLWLSRILKNVTGLSDTSFCLNSKHKTRNKVAIVCIK